MGRTSEEIIPNEDKLVFNYSDLSHGYELSSAGKYLLVGSRFNLLHLLIYNLDSNFV